MKRYLCVFLITLLSGFCKPTKIYSQKTSSSFIKGIWITHNEKARIKVFKKKNGYYGKIVWLKNPTDSLGQNITDRNNPQENLRRRSLIGLQILNAISFENERWTNGTIYDPENGKTYTVSIRRKGKELELRGYSGESNIGRMQIWTRFK